MAITKHIAISLDNIFEWCRKSNTEIKEGCERYFDLLAKLVELQVRLNIPILTAYLLQENIEKSDNYIIFCDYMSDFFGKILDNPVIKDNKVKVSIFGKWYNLPGKAVESLKRVIEETGEYDSFFINFCINYDGQEEIVGACKLIARQVELGKIDPEMITKDTVKENVYSSYFLPPDVILVYGEKKLSGLLLWDSVNSKIEFLNKSFMEFEEGDLKKFME